MLAFPSNHYKDKFGVRKSTPKLNAYITSSTSATIEISVGDFQISVSDTTTPELLKMVLQVVADVK